MQLTTTPRIEANPAAARAAIAAAAGERLAALAMEAAELDSEDRCWQLRGVHRYAVACAREASTIRREAQNLADLKFAHRAKPTHIQVDRTAARLTRASRILHETAKQAGRGWLADIARDKASEAIEELYRIGGTAKPTDRNGWPL